MGHVAHLRRVSQPLNPDDRADFIACYLHAQTLYVLERLGVQSKDLHQMLLEFRLSELGKPKHGRPI